MAMKAPTFLEIKRVNTLTLSLKMQHYETKFSLLVVLLTKYVNRQFNETKAIW